MPLIILLCSICFGHYYVHHQLKLQPAARTLLQPNRT